MTRDEKIETIRRLKSDGLTDSQIAEVWGTSTSVVFRLRKSAGINGLPPNSRRPVVDAPRQANGDEALRARQINLIKAAWLRVVARAMAGEETRP